MTELDKLKTLTENARDKLVEESGGVGFIDGYCHENALYLCEYIQNNTQYTPHLRWGITTHRDGPYETLQNAEKDGAVHFWTELQTNNHGWIVLDLFSMPSPTENIERGDIIVGNPPKTYQQLENTLFEYDVTITSSMLLSYEDYEKLVQTHALTK